VLYIAQVLKRNRTLKVLNLSEDKLGVQGLMQISDALANLSMYLILDVY
jgi:protein phosphatase 1 regulatory subunit 37